MKKYLITFEWVETYSGTLEMDGENEDDAIQKLEEYLRKCDEPPRHWLMGDDYPFFDFKKIEIKNNLESKESKK